MRRKPGAAAAVAALTVAACSAGHVTASTGAARDAAPHGTPATTIRGCLAGAWADDVTDAGRLAWQVSLPATPGLEFGIPVQPLAVGGVTVFADGNDLYALALGNGRQLWHKALGTVGSDPVLGTVAWHGSVIALVGAQLVALDAATGGVRWTTALGGLYSGTLTVTSDGVALFRTGRQGTAMTAVDLSTGGRLWSRSSLTVYRLAASGPVAVVASKTSLESPLTLTGIAARSGAVLWSRSFPGWADIMAAPGGPVFVYLPAMLPPPGKSQTSYPVTALSAGTGKTLWQLQTYGQPEEIWAAPAGVAVVAQFFGNPFSPVIKIPPPTLYLVGSATGTPRWSVAVPGGQVYPYPEVTPVITAAGVTTAPGRGTVADYSARSGAVEWKTAPGAASADDEYLARPAGPDILVIAQAGGSSRLLALDAATGAAKAADRLPFTSTVAAPPTVVGGSALVESQTATCSPGGGTLGQRQPAAAS